MERRGTAALAAASSLPEARRSKTGGARFSFIDSLRGLASLAVVMFHAHAGGHLSSLCAEVPALAAVMSHGDLGVQVFFVLSGFVIAHSVAGRRVDRVFIGRFILRRSIRLDLPYWASIAFVVGFGLLSARFVPGKSYQVPSAEVVAGHVAYMPLLLGQPLINSVYWTLCLEVQFYLVFVAMMWIAARLSHVLDEGRAFAAIFVPALLFADLWALGMGPINIPGLFFGHWFFFLTGVCVWWALASASPSAKFVLLVHGGGLALVGAAQGNLALFMAALAGIAIFVAGWNDKLGDWLNAQPLLLLGSLSYSLYLIHNPVTGAVFRLGFGITGRSSIFELAWLFATIAVCLAAAAAFHRLVEQPALRLSHRIRVAAF
jgi:peptidoglycan/LPS O-acetylase OafA/YrhL